MAKISLRSYLREISNLIDRTEFAEAVAHCKYILKIYPKHTATYSMLGKVYLESQRYSEALDIYQRVLSVFPDDYVAHLCVSIIREDEENLDAAIYHMERAYEVQPANSAIQEELRRLYGRRDGVIPPRVRLTRGALVRMYERGELYRQAIAEILAALAEDPNRLDLMVILCRTYFLSGQKVEATETATRLIAKLPYCYEANRVLAEILPTTSRAGEAELFHKRVIEIDPYQAFVTPSVPATAQVPDNAILLEKLDYQYGDTSSDTGWEQNLGINLPSESREETLPDWFQSTEQETPSLPEPDLPSAEPAAESDIPDFIRAAGFTQAQGPEQPPAEAVDYGESLASGELASAEIPDWLQSLAPEETPQAQSTSAEDEQWLAGLTKAGEQSAASIEETGAEVPQYPLSEEMSQVPETPQANLPDWLQGEGIVSEEAAPASSALPEWLNQPPVMPDRNELAEESTTPTEIPDWLQGMDLTAPVQESAPEVPESSNLQPDEEELPGWLQENAPVTPEPANLGQAAATGEPLESLDLPDWLQDITPQASTSETPAEGVTAAIPEPTPETPDWLGALTAEPTAEMDETSETEPASEPGSVTPAELPDWLAGLGAAAQTPTAEATPAEELPEIPTGESVAEPETPAPAELPDWLVGLGAVAETPTPEAAPAEELPEITPEMPVSEPEAESGTPAPAELPDWLAGLEPVAEPPAEEIPASVDLGMDNVPAEEISAVTTEEMPETESTLEIPDQIGEPVFGITETPEEAAAPTQPLATRAPVEPPAPPEEVVTPEPVLDTEQPQEAQPDLTAEMPTDLDAALAWMEALAARQGADEATLSGKPEDRLEEMPAWLQQEVENAPESTLPPPPPDEGEKPAGEVTELEESTPAVSEIAPFEPVAEIQPEPGQIPPADEIPAEPVAEEPQAGEQALTEAETITTPEVPAFEPPVAVEELAKSEELPAASEEAEAGLPDWLRGIEEESIPAAQPTAEELSEEWVQEAPVATVPETSEAPVGAVEPVSGISQETPVLEAAPEAVEPVAPIERQPEPVSPASPDLLSQGQAALRHNHIDEAVSNYEQLVNSGSMIEETIHDLREAIDRYPMEIPLYQLLGDAYMRSNRLQDAIDAYTKAEQLLR